MVTVVVRYWLHILLVDYVPHGCCRCYVRLHYVTLRYVAVGCDFGCVHVTVTVTFGFTLRLRFWLPFTVVYILFYVPHVTLRCLLHVAFTFTFPVTFTLVTLRSFTGFPPLLPVRCVVADLRFTVCGYRCGYHVRCGWFTHVWLPFCTHTFALVPHVYVVTLLRLIPRLRLLVVRCGYHTHHAVGCCWLHVLLRCLRLFTLHVCRLILLLVALPPRLFTLYVYTVTLFCCPLVALHVLLRSLPRLRLLRFAFYGCLLRCGCAITFWLDLILFQFPVTVDYIYLLLRFTLHLRCSYFYGFTVGFGYYILPFTFTLLLSFTFVTWLRLRYDFTDLRLHVLAFPLRCRSSIVVIVAMPFTRSFCHCPRSLIVALRCVRSHHRCHAPVAVIVALNRYLVLH